MVLVLDNAVVNPSYFCQASLRLASAKKLYYQRSCYCSKIMSQEAVCAYEPSARERKEIILVHRQEAVCAYEPSARERKEIILSKKLLLQQYNEPGGGMCMKVADKVTTIRIILAPVFFIVFNFYKFFNSESSAVVGRFWQIPVLWIIFSVAELSDMLDGVIARRLGEVSDFGKLYDPFADTLFQFTIFLGFVWHNILPMLPFLLVVYREFAILFVRNLMQKKGVSMGARIGGKIKTVAYITAGVFALVVYSLRILFRHFSVAGKTDMYDWLYAVFSRSAVVVFILAVVLSFLSFADYLRVYLKSSKQ